MFGHKRQAERVGEWEAFEAEALPHVHDLYRVAMWLARDRTAAEDLVQETLMQALQSFHRFERGSNCRAWLTTIMYHMNSKRKRASAKLRLVSEMEERIAETIAFEPPTPQGITEDEVRHALARLSPEFQEVVMLSDVEDLSYKEIAETLSIPVGTVMSRLHRGRKLLRAELAVYAKAHGIGRREEGGQQRPTSLSG